MKKFFFLLLSVGFLSACSATTVLPDQKEERVYLHKDKETCDVIRFQCDEGYAPFFDEWGCGCEREGSGQGGAGGGDKKMAAGGEACGTIDGRQVMCQEGFFCGNVEIFSSEPRNRCLPVDFCQTQAICPVGQTCMVLESWPAQVKCIAQGSAEGGTTSMPSSDPMNQPSSDFMNSPSLGSGSAPVQQPSSDSATQPGQTGGMQPMDPNQISPYSEGGITEQEMNQIQPPQLPENSQPPASSPDSSNDSTYPIPQNQDSAPMQMPVQ